MTQIKYLLAAGVAIALSACAPSSVPETPETATDSLQQMRSEFMESCQARREYIRQKRAGTLEKLCNCIFKTTMRGLSEDEQVTAAFYLYGEQHEAFLKRFQANPPPMDAMPGAIKAVAGAAKICH